MIASLSVMSMAFGRRANGMMSMVSPRSITSSSDSGNAVVAGADQFAIDRLALGEELQAADAIGALGEIGELIVASDLSGRELVKVHGDQIGVRVVRHCSCLELGEW